MLSTHKVKTVQVGLTADQWAKLQVYMEKHKVSAADAARRLLDLALK